MPVLSVMNSQGRNASFGIAWPCSGIESLLIYTLMILLFLKNSMIPLKHRILYFIFGAVVTFFINVFRIATIFVIALDTSANSIQVHRFHDYYGWLFSLTWIVLYPLIVIVSRNLWIKMKSWGHNVFLSFQDNCYSLSFTKKADWTLFFQTLKEPLIFWVFVW